MNPDYRWPDWGNGEQLPEVTETYTLYPDGTGLRHMVYRPKLDTAHRKWNELAELIVVAGTKHHPADLLASPALTVSNLAGDSGDCHPPRELPSGVRDWPQVIMAAHFREAPDAFCAFSDAADVPDVHSYYPLAYDISWHGTGYKMCHWPVGLEPYQVPSKTHGTWRGQVSHTSLMGVGAHKGSRWQEHTKPDADGRPCRDWTMLFGLSRANDSEDMNRRTASWLYPPSVDVESPGWAYLGPDRRSGELVFRCAGPAKELRVRLTPSERARAVCNPVLRIVGLDMVPSRVLCDGKELSPGADVQVAVIADGLLVRLPLLSKTSVDVSLAFVEI